MIDLIKGKYRITREIARSNDIVYEAQDTALGNRQMALKVLNFPPNLTGQARRERIERFNREARAAGRLSHPNIVTIYEYGEDQGNYFIAMEFLRGQTLRDALQARGVLPLKEAVEIACQMLDALQYAHVSGVIHRDIKPDNIFILPGGQVKLTDFGIARLTEEASLTSDGQIFGTPSYMSPEQIEGRGIDFRSDLFSLGVLLYEMLAGRKPFTGDSVVSITYAVMHAEPPPLIGVPQGIEQVVRRALAKNPLQRHNSADQMKLDLRAAEQTPAIFLPQSMHQTGNFPTNSGYGVSPGGYPNSTGGYNATGGGYVPGNTGYGPPILSPAPGYPPPQPMGQTSGQRWAWNQTGYGAPSPMGGNGAMPAGTGPLPSLNGQIPGAAPPFPRADVPLFPPMSPAVRNTLLSILAAIVLGGLGGLGVIGLLRRYDQFQQNARYQQVVQLTTQAQSAYNGHNFTSASRLFEQALAAQPDPQQRALIQTQLGYTYVQLARVARGQNDVQAAKTDYQKALSYSPNDPIAHQELSLLLETLGDHQGAQQEQQEQQRLVANGIINGASVQDAPKNLNSSTLALPGPDGPAGGGSNSDAFLQQRRAEAAQLIQEGDALQQQGNLDAARQKWTDAVSKAAGLPERDAAQQRLQDTQSGQ